MTPLSPRTAPTGPRLDSMLDALDAEVPPVLVARGRRAALYEVAHRLPCAMMAGFEAHLSADPAAAGRADFAVRVANGEPTTAHWRRLSRDRASSAWGRVDRCLALPAVRDLWLELDVDAEVSAPSVFCGLGLPPVATEGLTVPRATESVLAALGADPVAMATLRRVHGRLPVGAQLFQVGLMLARPGRGLRALVRNLSPAAAARLLRAQGLEREVPRIAEVWSRFAPLVDCVFVSLDIGAQVGSRVGLELMFRDQSAVAFDPRWDRLLAAFESDGLCSAAQRRALARWPGWTTQATAAGHWPAHLRTAARLSPGRCPAYARMNNHAKLVIAPGRPLAAKVYFGAQQTWRDGC